MCKHNPAFAVWMYHALFISGGGTTAKAIFKATQPGGMLHGKVRIPCVIASANDIGGIKLLAEAGLPEGQIEVVNPKDYPTEEALGLAINDVLWRYGALSFGLHGWMPRMPKNVIARRPGINQHPAALDPSLDDKRHWDFGGKGMYGRAAMAAQLYFAKLVAPYRKERLLPAFCAEATAQLVHEEYDRGLLVYTEPLELDPNWTVEEMKPALLQLEHEVQIKALRQVHHYRNFGGVVRQRRLILPGEETFFAQAKALAIADYPHG